MRAQRHWSRHISSTVYLAFHSISRSAISVAAHTASVSPARRGPNAYGIFLPHAFSIAATISRTVEPVPVPTLMALQLILALLGCRTRDNAAGCARSHACPGRTQVAVIIVPLINNNGTRANMGSVQWQPTLPESPTCSLHGLGSRGRRGVSATVEERRPAPGEFLMFHAPGRPCNLDKGMPYAMWGLCNPLLDAQHTSPQAQDGR
jgi:hypothetical protein